MNRHCRALWASGMLLGSGLWGCSPPDTGVPAGRPGHYRIVNPSRPVGQLNATQAAERLAEFFTPGELAILQHPDRVRATRLGIPRVARRYDLADYPHLGEPVTLSPEVGQRLGTLVSTPLSYVWDLTRGCQSYPQVLLEFAAHDERVEVLICFECWELELQRDGKKVSRVAIDPMLEELRDVLYPLFADDKYLQQIR